MIILKEGSKTQPAWWHDAVLECKSCKRSIKLESSDVSNKSLTIKTESVSYVCETCGQKTSLKQADARTLLLETPAATPSPAVTPAPEYDRFGAKPAAFGNKVTQGYSNPFGGTSWGV